MVLSAIPRHPSWNVWLGLRLTGWRALMSDCDRVRLAGPSALESDRSPCSGLYSTAWATFPVAIGPSTGPPRALAL